MELAEFIKKASTIVTQDQSSITIFQGASYPHLFFTHYFDSVKYQEGYDFKMLDIQSGDFTFKSQLGTSFLGMSCTYWLGNASSLKIKQKNELIDFLASYEGPHKVMVFFDIKTSFTPTQNLSVVHIKDKYFFNDAKLLWVANIEEAQKTAFFLNQIYKIKNSFSLDELFSLKNYQDLLGSEQKIFYKLWIPRLVEANTSIFTLSQFLFEKKENSFFQLWLEMKPLYSDMFWVSFLSDQMYRAYFFIRFTHEKNYAAAKQISFGLSFSFLKQTYKQYDLQELKNVHQALYALDGTLKNGGNSYQLDQICIQFFSNDFKHYKNIN